MTRVKPRTDPQQSQIAEPKNELCITFTVFKDVYAKRKRQHTVSWNKLVKRIHEPETHQSKGACPLISLAEYGTERTGKGSLRHGANVRRVHGVEIDYDGEQVPIAEGARRLQAKNLEAVLYTSPSHTPERPRWRALLPCAEPVSPEQRAELVARVHTVLDRIVKGESFALSQAFYFGRVQGRAYEVHETHGRTIDAAIELQPTYPKSSSEGGQAKSHASAPPKAARRIESLDELDQWHLPQRVKVIIQKGCDPDNPKAGDDSRSAWVFDAVCAMVRAGVPDEVILGILLDSRFSISESILEKKTNAERYARKQIASAHKDVAGGPLLLHPDSPLDSARQYKLRWRPTLMHNNDDYLAYDGASYVELEEATVKSELYSFLESAQVLGKKDGETARPFNPNRTKLANVIDALKGVVHRERDRFAPPCWLSGEGPPPSQIVACRNGLLHLPTGELLPPTERFFTRNALEFDYCADAPKPERWSRMLAEYWPSEDGTVATLQEMFGYLLIPDTSQQKIFLLIGPTRSGKGTIARVLTSLVGKQNTCAPTLNGMGGEFGFEPLIGKQLAIISDMRLGKKSDHAAIAENLLRISGEDTVTAGRKYKRAWDGRLAVRFLIMTNLMPRFADVSGALANRFVPIVMNQSFLGRENPALIAELLAERAGIFNWAIEGWQRLRDRGHFILPKASSDAMRDLADLASPESAFIRDRCVLMADGRVPKAAVFEAWGEWCASHGDLRQGTLDVFSSRLQAASGGKVGVGKFTYENSAGKREPSFTGIRLKIGPELDDDERELF